MPDKRPEQYGFLKMGVEAESHIAETCCTSQCVQHDLSRNFVVPVVSVDPSTNEIMTLL